MREGTGVPAPGPQLLHGVLGAVSPALAVIEMAAVSRVAAVLCPA